MNIESEQITPALTWQLRRDVLYPGQYLHDMEMPEDEDGQHFGAFVNNALVGVVSVFAHTDGSVQFRKLAVAASHQAHGIGSALMEQVNQWALTAKAHKLWCNARLNATGFYTKLGFSFYGEAFSKNGVDFIIMQRAL